MVGWNIWTEGKDKDGGLGWRAGTWIGTVDWGKVLV